MVCKNNYKLSIYNGDIGKVMSIQYNSDRSATIIAVKIFGAVPTYISLTLDEAKSILRLAYAMTVHKAQGQEYDNILLPWTISMGRQLQRTLLYTAITRAKRRVVVFGQWEAVQRAVQNSEQAKRNTCLAQRLRGYMGV
jgi:exodeoxyribonuclease V alpha subunit